ncbi:MAG: hypothetical protein KDJ99_27240 [Candidatus Competibacteraceae bacterium]|nr:hypothetical protein [Candidatus Competibacteraceae bacterium]
MRLSVKTWKILLSAAGLAALLGWLAYDPARYPAKEAQLSRATSRLHAELINWAIVYTPPELWERLPGTRDGWLWGVVIIGSAALYWLLLCGLARLLAGRSSAGSTRPRIKKQKRPRYAPLKASVPPPDAWVKDGRWIVKGLNDAPRNRPPVPQPRSG